MLTTDWAYLLADLARLGHASTVQVSRATKTGRTARGVVEESWAPVGDPLSVLITRDAAILADAGLGDRSDISAAMVCAPQTDLADRDTVTVVSGARIGRTYRVIEVRGDASAMEPMVGILDEVRA